MRKIFKLIIALQLFIIPAIAQHGSGGQYILGNATPLEGSTETYHIESRGEPVPPGSVFQWVITNGIKIAENINPSAGNLSVTVKWNFGVTTGRVTMNELQSQTQIYKDVQIIPYYVAQPFCNQIEPLHQEMVWSQTGQTLYAPRTTCAIDPANPYQITYKWQNAWLLPDDDWMPNPVLNWQDVTGATAESIIPPAVNDYGSMYYRRIMYIANSSGTILATITSNPVRGRLSGLASGQIFDINDPANPDAVITLPYTASTTVNETEATGGLCVNKSYVWEISVEGSPWIVMGTGQACPTDIQDMTRGNFLLRRKVICGPQEAFSNILSYIVTYQSSFFEPMNYGRVHIITKPGVKDFTEVDQLPVGEQFVTTDYKDGLGRTIQANARGITNINGEKGDIVTHVAYDANGRADKAYLPFTTTDGVGFFKERADRYQNEYIISKYGEPANAPTWTQTFFEESPLGRPLNVKEAGAARGGNPLYKGNRMEYDLNTSDEKVRIWNMGINSGDIPTSDLTEDIYGTGKLYKIKLTDVEGRLTIEYKDFSGNLVLKKVQDKELAGGLSNQHKGWTCTYYIYDDLGRQRFILTPKAVDYLDDNGWNLSANTAIIKDLCFYTDFDSKGRVIIAHRPGTGNTNSKGEVYTIYDRRDRIVFSQDENQRKRQSPQWAYALYDEVDRNVVSGLVDLNMSRADLQNAVDHLGNGNMAINIFTGASETITVNDPVVGNSSVCPTCTNMVVNTVSYYDEHNYTGVKPYDPAYTFPAAQLDMHPNISTVTKRTQGLITGGKTRILDGSYDDNNPQNDRFLTSTVYYDEKSQAFETLTENIKGGTDVGITQFDYTGIVLSSIEKRNIPGTAYSNYTITSRSEYDYTGKPVASYKTYGSNTEKELARVEYDDMGVQKNKTLAPGYTGSNAGYMESLQYSYDILGKLTGINKDYALAPNYSGDQWNSFFGLYLGYENMDNVFNKSSFTGQLTGVQWRTQGDNISRKYDYTYDNLGRFRSAAFVQKEKPGEAWTNGKYDFTVNNITYDLNGNLGSMTQYGAIPGTTGSIVIDKLNYTYQVNSNRLLKVTDNGDLAGNNGKLGDFTDGSNAANDDYVYDDNGNLLIDRNKNIYNGVNSADGVVYNFLDKPQKIYIQNKSTLEFMYDATGGKIAKKVTPVSGTAKTTWYLGSFVFEETTNMELQFISNETGRLRLVQPRTMQTPPAYYDLEVSGGIPMPDGKIGVFDYFITDHLGSTRMVLSEEIHRERHSCNMDGTDPTRDDYEKKNFGQVLSTGQPSPASNEVINTRSAHPNWTSNASPKSSKLGGPGNNNKIGPNMLLKVMAGDELTLSVKYFYNGSTTNPQGSGLSGDIGILIGNLLSNGNSTNGGIKDFGTDIGAQLGTAGSSLSTFLNTQNPAAANRPNAWLNWLFFDENFNLILPEGPSGVRVNAPQNGNPVDQSIFIPNLKVPANGYVLVYVSNESTTTPVYFDDLDITHVRGRITEESHYYAFGQKIHGIGGKSFGKLDNKYKYQGAYAEEEEETGWNEFDLRMYDPQTGRWLGADPYDEFASPYTGMGNDPVNNFDEDGGSVSSPDWYATLNKDNTVSMVYLQGRTDGSFYQNGQQWENVAKDNVSAEEAISYAEGIFRFRANVVSTPIYPNEQATVIGLKKKKDPNCPMCAENGKDIKVFEQQVDPNAPSFSSPSSASIAQNRLDPKRGERIYQEEKARERYNSSYAGTFTWTFRPAPAMTTDLVVRPFLENCYYFGQGVKEGDWDKIGVHGFGIILTASPLLKSAPKGGTTIIYRVVSRGEASDVFANGFRQAPISTKISSYEGKLFWTNVKDAKWYQNWAGKNNQILKVKVKKGFIFENGNDAGHPFYFVSPERLNQFNAAIKSIK